MTGFRFVTNVRAVLQFIVLVLFCESQSASPRKPLLLHRRPELS